MSIIEYNYHIKYRYIIIYFNIYWYDICCISYIYYHNTSFMYYIDYFILLLFIFAWRVLNLIRWLKKDRIRQLNVDCLFVIYKWGFLLLFMALKCKQTFASSWNFHMQVEITTWRTSIIPSDITKELLNLQCRSWIMRNILWSCA